MHILVTTSSEHGATDEVADAIAKHLGAAGFTVGCAIPAGATTVGSCDAVVVGSAVYILQWMPEAHDFTERFKDDLRDKPVWAFSVGINDVPNHSQQGNNRVGPLLTHVNCCELRTFPGRYKPELLSLHKRSAACFVGVVEDDFRGWDAIDAWADDIAVQLGA